MICRIALVQQISPCGELIIHPSVGRDVSGIAQSGAEFDRLLRKAAELRGHLCIGLPLGLKMASLGLRLLNMEDEKKRDYLVVFVENDRCAVDAIQVATGCSAGSRRLKVFEYGKSAASFVDGASRKGFRIVTKKDFMARAVELAVEDGIIAEDESVDEGSSLGRQVMMNAFLKMAPEQLFDVQEVTVESASTYLPGGGSVRGRCWSCGEEVMDGRGVVQQGKMMCRACAFGAYYRTTV